MDFVMILLRLVHIAAGVFWVGGALMMTLFVGPAVASDPQGGSKVLQYLMGTARVSARLSAAAGLSVLAGVILYWLDTDGFTSAWAGSGPGIGFGLGGVFGLAAFIAGTMIGRNNKALAMIGAQVQGQPTTEQAGRIAAIRKNLALLTPINTITLILAVLLMATARYYSF